MPAYLTHGWNSELAPISWSIQQFPFVWVNYCTPESGMKVWSPRKNKSLNKCNITIIYLLLYHTSHMLGDTKSCLEEEHCDIALTWMFFPFPAFRTQDCPRIRKNKYLLLAEKLGWRHHAGTKQKGHQIYRMKKLGMNTGNLQIHRSLS